MISTKKQKVKAYTISSDNNLVVFTTQQSAMKLNSTAIWNEKELNYVMLPNGFCAGIPWDFALMQVPPNQ